MNNLDQKLFPHEDELQGYEGKWKNLYFYRNGCGWGNDTFPTKQAAKESAAEFRRESDELLSFNLNLREYSNGTSHFSKDYLFTIQIPVKP